MQESIWTIDSLHEHLLRIVADQAAKHSALADAQDKAVQAALVAQEKAVQAALAAADKAVSKAEEGALAWRESANEWRGAMTDRERTFITRSEHEQGMTSMAEKIALLKEYSDSDHGRGRGQNAIWSQVIPIIRCHFRSFCYSV